MIWNILLLLLGLVGIIYVTAKYDVDFVDIVILWVAFSVYFAGWDRW